MQNVVNSLKSSGLKVAEYFTPVLKESKFVETGVITPEEFVAAGDHLVHHCPSWQWASGDPAGQRDFLPKDKQFLITRNVPCFKRCQQMMAYSEQKEVIIEAEDGDEEGWVDTQNTEADGKDVAEKISEMRLGDDDEKGVAAAAVTAKSEDSKAVDEEGDNDDDEEEAVDMEDFIDSGMLEKEAQDAASVAAAAVATAIKDKDAAAGADGGEIVATRTYDLNITYDKYYQTPRLWLFGYDEKRKALSVDEMYEDFSADHANKTITMEAHPHLPAGPPQASVHPCKHAQLMKKLLDQIVEGGRGELGVHMYLIVFLKFVQAIIPTIEYDFTQNIAL